MLPINNSDTAWLIVSDFNQDNNKFYEELREDILNPETNDWIYEHFVYMQVGSDGIGVGSIVGATGDSCGNVGAGSEGLSPDFTSTLVGGSM